MEYSFTLTYQFVGDIDRLLEKIGESGCDDALVGLGRPGHVALAFTREVDCFNAATALARLDVERTIPSAGLVAIVAPPQGGMPNRGCL
jgi:hypothetical protein